MPTVEKFFMVGVASKLNHVFRMLYVGGSA